MDKITLKEFWDSGEELAIHCDTEDKANKLLKAFDKMGKKWYDEDSYLETTMWDKGKETTCYTNKRGYASLDWFYWFKKHNCIVYEFEDVIFDEEEKIKMTDNVKKIFEMLNLKPNEKFKIECFDDTYYFDEILTLYRCLSSNEHKVSHFALNKFIIGELTIVKLPKKKKLRDLTLEEYDIWCDKHCDSYGDKCEKCPFNYVECGIINDGRCWVEHKDLYSDKFLNQEIEVE